MGSPSGQLPREFQTKRLPRTPRSAGSFPFFRTAHVLRARVCVCAMFKGCRVMFSSFIFLEQKRRRKSQSLKEQREAQRTEETDRDGDGNGRGE